ncbi:MAG: murein biosynthesis integral membrane protein MurJ [Candidatus Babeliaceae bacterium]|jgi:putative peptidoglycan lipid II flippase
MKAVGIKKSGALLLRKTIGIGAWTLLSRILGLIREVLQIKYLGVGTASDAFIAAFRIPNSLRKIFAEGALTAAFLPTYVATLQKEGEVAADKVATITFVILQSFLLLVCVLIGWHAHTIIYLIAPGWSAVTTADQAAQLLNILIYFIFFISSSSLCASILQARHHFFIPAVGQIVMNLFFIAQLIILTYYHAPVYYLAYGILLNGVVLLTMHIWACYRWGFMHYMPDRHSLLIVWRIVKKFVPCLLSVGALEINLFIDQMLASYLPAGSLTLLYYVNTIGRVPLSIFVIALSTILLPHFAHVHTYAPRRLNFYILESAKFIFWVIAPTTILMSIFSYQAFYTIMLSSAFTLQHVYEAAWLLRAFALGLFFFSLNRILLNVFYAMHETFIPTLIACGAAVFNTGLSMILMMYWGACGITLATSIAEIVKTGLFIMVLQRKYGVVFYGHRFMQTAYRCCAQLCVIGIACIVVYAFLYVCIMQLPIMYKTFLLARYGYWLWVAPLCGFGAFIAYITRRQFNITLYFLP